MTGLPNHLKYVSDDQPGIKRRRRGQGFSYYMPDGSTIGDKKERARIEALAVPPAYENVWICPLAYGHLQATGMDERERKQYRYHPDWRAFRDAEKYAHLLGFAEGLPRLRRRVSKDLEVQSGAREHTLAALVTLLDNEPMRVGNDIYAKKNGTVGAVTLTLDNLKTHNGEAVLNYKAKGGRQVQRVLENRKLHEILEEISDLPGKELFVYEGNDGDYHHVDSGLLNDYLKDVMGKPDVSAKTFRTWGGTLAAFETAQKCLMKGSVPTIKAMSKASAKVLRNTPAISRKSYIHPSVIALSDTDMGEISKLGKRLNEKGGPSGLRATEARLFKFLEISDKKYQPSV